jgi:hypothetical protein
MKNTKEFLKEFYTKELKITHGAKGDTIHQTQRNMVKAALIDAIQADLADELGIDALRTSDGVAVLMDNESEGGVPFVLDIAMKSFDYDIYKEHDAYAKDKEIKADKAEQRAKAKRTKFKNDTAARALKESKATK